MIYYVHCERTGLTKIGYTAGLNSVAKRLRGLQSGSSTRLLIVSLVEGDMAAERALHREHHGRRVHHEWFRDVAAPPTKYPVDVYPTNICAQKSMALVAPPVGPRPPCVCIGCGVKVKKSGSRCRPCAIAAGTDCAARLARAAHRREVKHGARERALAGYATSPTSAVRKAVASAFGITERTVYRVLRGKSHERSAEIRAASLAAGWRPA